MCGIVGYIGNRQAQQILLSGLSRLEYRGYDSSGMAVILSGKNKISIRKSPGKIKALEAILQKKPLIGNIGIAHTRWATHGAPNQLNAHPHYDCKEEIAVVHNGIIENYIKLKAGLQKSGHKFVSETDTEVLAHLIEDHLNDSNLEDAVRKTLMQLEGSFAIGVVSNKEPDKIIAARSGSPLIVGLGKGENFIASDVPAILDFTKDVIFLEENQIVVLTKDTCKVMDLSGHEMPHKISHIDWDIVAAEKQGYRHFMLKEINEQPRLLEMFQSSRIKDDNHVEFEEQHIPESILKEIKT